MEFGTLKSEVWSQYKGVSEDYYHYEIITRWWKKENDSGFEWKHTLLYISRDGSVKDYLDTNVGYTTAEHIQKYLSGQPSSANMVSVAMKSQISEQHAYLVRTVMG